MNIILFFIFLMHKVLTFSHCLLCFCADYCVASALFSVKMHTNWREKELVEILRKVHIKEKFMNITSLWSSELSRLDQRAHTGRSSRAHSSLPPISPPAGCRPGWWSRMQTGTASYCSMCQLWLHSSHS
ncbi:hypothetical protein NL108_006506 [Boleophthalmus pectinirostris]|nr:hypothetical protein NL108_006506 [Boleophthalmus pectinirostris]